MVGTRRQRKATVDILHRQPVLTIPPLRPSDGQMLVLMLDRKEKWPSHDGRRRGKVKVGAGRRTKTIAAKTTGTTLHEPTIKTSGGMRPTTAHPGVGKMRIRALVSAADGAIAGNPEAIGDRAGEGTEATDVRAGVTEAATGGKAGETTTLTETVPPKGGKSELHEA